MAKGTVLVAGEAKRQCMQAMLDNPSDFSGHELQLMRKLAGVEPSVWFGGSSAAFSLLMHDIVEPWANRHGISIVHI